MTRPFCQSGGRKEACDDEDEGIEEDDEVAPAVPEDSTQHVPYNFKPISLVRKFHSKWFSRF